MPELPEVEITKRKLEPLKGRRIKGFWSDWPRGLRITGSVKKIDKDIKGRKILSGGRYGKAIVFELEKRKGDKKGEKILAFHQRMSGSLLIRSKVDSQKAKVDGQKDYVHAKVLFEDRTELWFKDPRKFGVIWYGKPTKVWNDNYFKCLGPDALDIAFKDFWDRLTSHRGMIKPLLLRQDFIAGVGNIVADETLWEARIHPTTAITSLSKKAMRELFWALKKVLRRAIKAQGTTIQFWAQPDGEAGQFQEYFRVYGRRNKLCVQCKGKIIRIVVGSRGTWICPGCQKL